MRMVRNQVTGRVLSGVIFMSLLCGFAACNSDDKETVSVRNDAANSAGNQNLSDASDNKETANLDAEMEKLKKEREKLEKEKQSLKDEKAKIEKMKDALPPESELTDSVMITDPPTNIRDSPNGKVLCVVKDKAVLVKIYGTTGISDNNGEWFYTKHCAGKMGVIHSSQFVSPS